MTLIQVREEARRVFNQFDNHSQGLTEREITFIQGALWTYTHYDVIHDSLTSTAEHQYAYIQKYAALRGKEEAKS